MPDPVPVLLMVRELTAGGCERDLTKLAKHLDREQFTPYVACFHPTGYRAGELRAAGIPIRVFPVRSYYSPSTLKVAAQMRRFLKERWIQVVHPFDVPTDVFAVPVARLSGVPAVISAQLSYRHLYTAQYRRALKWTDPLAHRIVVNSAAVKKHLIADEGIAPERISVVHNGVETEVFYPCPTARPASLSGATLVIGSLCVLREEKRLDLLVSAFAKVRALRPGLKLLIVGSGPMLDDLTRQARELGVLADCIFEPAKADVSPWLRMMDVFVLSSSSESFPNALLEAMACGCAPIGSSVGGVPELIKHGSNGLLFPNGSLDELTACLGQLVTSDQQRSAFGAAAAETARSRFSMKIHVDKIQALYRELLGQSKRKPAV